MIGAYFALLSRRIDARPEDDPHGEIEQGAGDQGVFSPWSWWPLVLGVAGAITFAGLAIGWWLSYIGIALGVIGLVGWVFEFSRGPARALIARRRGGPRRQWGSASCPLR